MRRNIFMTEIHLRQPGFAHSACGLFTKSKEGIQRFKETRHLRYFWQRIRKTCL